MSERGILREKLSCRYCNFQTMAYKWMSTSGECKYNFWMFNVYFVRYSMSTFNELSHLILT
jgi:hypothetical protein